MGFWIKSTKLKLLPQSDSMTQKLADLHIHTRYSDSTSSPEEVVQQARACGLSCIAITDHDTIDGINPTMEAAKHCDLEVLSGIELSTEIQGKDIHILGYCFNHNDGPFIEHLKIIQNSRLERMKKMIEKLKLVGIKNIELEEVCALAKSSSLGRPHLAAMLVEKGIVTDRQTAFNKYLADGGIAYVPKYKQTPQEAIQWIQNLGGVTVLAHPALTQIDSLISGLVDLGLKGLEVYYANTSNQIIHFYEGLAKKYNLLMTGGSDAHGKAKRNTFIGKTKIPYELVEKLKERVDESRRRR